MRNRRCVIPVLGLLMLAACAKEPLEWGAITYRPSRLGDPDTRSVIWSANLPGIQGTVGSCIRSITTPLLTTGRLSIPIRAKADSLDRFRVWWSTRPDSSVVLAAQRSGDQGRSWLAPVVVDSTDKGRHGCERPAPGTAFDPRSGFLYVVYYIEPAMGAGIYFAHSMDRGDLFHAPVPVIYGKRPAKASVTGRGDSVIVVFEDPNANHPRVGYALSHTSGHFFERHGRVTPSEEIATAPWVTLNDSLVRVWWKNGERVGFRSGVWK